MYFRGKGAWCSHFWDDSTTNCQCDELMFVLEVRPIVSNLWLSRQRSMLLNIKYICHFLSAFCLSDP